jgi:hypothetical protein
MFTKKRAMCILAGSALLATLSGTIGSPAEAAGGSERNIPWVAKTYGGVSVLPQRFQAGDCHLNGVTETGTPSKAWIELVAADSDPPGYWIEWRYSMGTSQSYYPFPDVWHVTFVFKNGNGAELFRWNTDGPDMWTYDSTYTGAFEGLVHVTAFQVSNISMVDWYGDC